MAELTLQNVFGNSAVQTATTVTFTKSELAALAAAAGFTYTPSATDGAEKLFSAILMAASQNLNSTNRAADYTTRNVEISAPSYPSIVSQNSTNWQRDSWTVNLYKAFNYANLSANDY
jgi:hypothetical protein